MKKALLFASTLLFSPTTEAQNRPENIKQKIEYTDSTEQINDTITFEISENQKLVNEIISLLRSDAYKHLDNTYSVRIMDINGNTFSIEIKFGDGEFSTLPTKLTIEKIDSTSLGRETSTVFKEENTEFGPAIDGEVEYVQKKEADYTKEVPSIKLENLPSEEYQEKYEKVLKYSRNLLRNLSRMNASKKAEEQL